MKKIFPFLLAAAALACNKQLDLPQDGRITLGEVFNDYDYTRGYLNSCYGFVPGPHVDRSSFTDEAQDCDDLTANSRYRAWYAGDVTASSYAGQSSDGQPWQRLFEGIRKTNVFLNGIRDANIVASPEERNSWVAQAHTLRGLYYFQLIKRYGGVPIFDKPLPIGYDFSKDRRAKFSEVVAFIIKECDSALMVPVGRPGFNWDIYENQYGIMTRAVAYAVRSQAMLYAASPLWNDGSYTWQQVATATGEALGQCLANGYTLFNEVPDAAIAQNGYALYHFITSNDMRTRDKETILHTGGQMAMWQNAGLPSTPSMSKSGPNPTQEMVDRYEMANGEAPILGYSDADRLTPIINPASGYDPQNPYTGRDPRFYASIYYNGAVRNLDAPAGKKVETFVGGAEGINPDNRRFTRTGYYVRKFNNWKSKQNGNADGSVRLIHLAELYLNFAEAANQAVGPDVKVTVGTFSMTAREAVNAVRARVGMPAFPTGMSKETFDKKYRNERAVELAFEEHRFFDVRRWKTLAETDKFVTGMRITNNNGVLSYQRFRFEDRSSNTDRFLMYPIDQNEADKIRELTGVNWQNPGWNE
ncbi:RagB/SusD family nutrient uptake outer membrane protein [Chitinophaga deserti]|uniref:RagB/SusD family nutrient uptake outer membrane protein n=1 Tax=Chitinophaga deserti TaxID=2164099 RepID=UPI000D6CCA34|nr:RagB/SusD family nutrient uptake outer membrane protein [Chitinophaga deserti]